MIETRQNTVQVIRAALRRPLPESLPQLLRALRAGKQAFEQGSKIEAGASHNDRQTASRVDLFQNLACLPGVFSRRHIFRRVDTIEQMMRNARTLGRRRFRGSNVE